MKRISELRRAASAKIRSDKGASLSIALLLFLVCTVVGAVVLTAGTAAAGRLADMPEADQRYYSVASAVQLLAKELDKKDVTIVRTKTTTTTTKYTAGDGATLVPDGDPNVTDVYSVSVKNNSGVEIVKSDSSDATDDGFSLATKKDASGNSVSFLTARAIYLLFGRASDGKTVIGCKKTDATPELDATTGFMGLSFTSGKVASSVPDETNFTITHSNPTGSIDASSLGSVTVYGKATVSDDGTITIDISDKEVGSADLKYTMTMTLHPVFTETQASETSGGDSPKTVNGNEYTYEKITTLTKTSTVHWEVSNIKKKM